MRTHTSNNILSAFRYACTNLPTTIIAAQLDLGYILYMIIWYDTICVGHTACKPSPSTTKESAMEMALLCSCWSPLRRYFSIHASEARETGQLFRASEETLECPVTAGSAALQFVYVVGCCWLPERPDCVCDVNIEIGKSKIGLYSVLQSVVYTSEYSLRRIHSCGTIFGYFCARHTTNSIIFWTHTS